MFYERELYPLLVKWVTGSRPPRHALYLEGPRQVGKTEIILKLSREYFEHCTYINLRDNGNAQKFDELTTYYYEKLGSKPAEETGPVWEGVFQAFRFARKTQTPPKIRLLTTLSPLTPADNSRFLGYLFPHFAPFFCRQASKSRAFLQGHYKAVGT